jgi:hypothetical protein
MLWGSGAFFVPRTKLLIMLKLLTLIPEKGEAIEKGMVSIEAISKAA